MAMEEARRRLGRFGVWIPPGTLLAAPVPMQREQFARIERLGYGSVWIGEPPPTSPSVGRDAFAQLAVVLAATERLVAGTGIANVGTRHPVAMHGAAATLAEAYPQRVIIGLGGHSGDRPLSRLREYLDAMDQAAARLLPTIHYPRVLAALGPKAHRLVGDRADGAVPFLQPVEHTEIARKALGADPLLIPHQALVLETDAAAARERIRAVFGFGRSGRAGVETPYSRNYRRLGYGDDDLAGERSDRLVDAIVAWGGEATVAGRLRDHLDAGADHVVLQPLASDLPAGVDQLERLARDLNR